MSDTINFEPGKDLPESMVTSSGSALLAQEAKYSRRLMLVEEIPVLRAHLRKLLIQLLGPECQIIEESVAKDAILQASELDLDLVVLDLEPSGASGLHIAQQIWTKNERTRILFWCNRHRSAVVSRLRKIAPSNALYGYTLKSQPAEELTFAIQCLLVNDNSYIAPSVRQQSVSPFALTDIEYETLYDLAAGLTDKAISLRCGTSTRTIQYRIAGLLAKILRLDEAKTFEFGLERGFLNARVLVVAEALRQGLLDFDHLNAADYSFWQWRGAKTWARRHGPLSTNESAVSVSNAETQGQNLESF